MTGQNNPAINVLLAAPTMDSILTSMYPPFQSDTNRYHIASISADWDDLVNKLRTMNAEALIVEGDIANTPQQLADTLANFSGLSIVIIPPAWAGAEGVFRNIDRVKDVFIGPHINYAEVAQKAYSAVITARELNRSAAPMAQMYRPTAPGSAHVVGLKVFAFWSPKGGVGKTTVSTNFAYELARRGVRTLLLGFDIPDGIGVQYGLARSPNSMNFYTRPGTEGFTSSIQKPDANLDLDVILSPNDPIAATRVAGVAKEEPGSIRSFIQTAWTMNYGAVVMDLMPSMRDEWALQPLMQANTVLFVAKPSYEDLVKLIEGYRLLVHTLAGQHRIPPESMYIILNTVTPQDNLLPDTFHQAAVNHLKQVTSNNGHQPFPPIIATVPQDNNVRPLQNEGKVPVMYADEFGGSIRSLVNTFYRSLATDTGVSTASGKRKGRSFKLPGIRFKVK